MSQEISTFESWAIVEVMGRQTYAGFVTERVIGGSAFIQVSVPESGEFQAFTKMFGAGSIYCITPCTEEVAKRYVSNHRKPAVDPWELREQKPQALIGQSQQRTLDFDDDLDEGDGTSWT